MTDLRKAVLQSEAIQHGLVQLSNLHFGRDIFFFMDIEAWNSNTWKVEFYIEDAQDNLDESREDQLFLAGMQQLCEVFGCKLLSDGLDEEGDHVPGFRGCQKFKFYNASKFLVA